VAFGHALGFQKMGFDAYTAPAARSNGDSFDLPRLDLHSNNIRMAFLKAAAFRLPGAILTSWSYRGSPHEVCLAEYVGTAYGWNSRTPAVPELLASLLRQRYGIDDPELARAMLADSQVVPASTLARPKLDDGKRAWVLSSEAQLEQIRQVAGREPDKQLQQLGSWLDQLSATTERLRRAKSAARRHQDELACWDLSYRHLVHRLRFVPLVVRLIRAKQANSEGPQVAEWKRSLESLFEPRARLRAEWAGLYRDVCTARHLEIELHNRFDAEADIIDRIFAGDR